MANKDHLPTPEETIRKHNRDLKRVVSTNFQGNPPVFTRSVDQIGIVARTTNEVKDTAFPVLADIEDLTDNVQTAVAGAVATIEVELGKAEAQFHRLELDDAAGAITEFIIDFVGLAKNKALQFIADIETIFTGTPTITFKANGSPITLGGLPSAFGDTGTNNFKFDIAAIDTPLIEYYEILNTGSASGANNEIRDGDTYAIVIDSVPTFAVFLNNIQKFSISNTRVDYVDLDLFGVTSISFKDTVDAATGTVFTQNQNDFNVNLVDNADIFEIDFNTQIGLSVDLLRTRFYSNTPNTISAAISLFRDDPSPNTADALGDINFDGRDSAGNFTTYADIIGGIESPTSTAEIGRLTIRLQDSGAMQQVMRLTLDEIELTDLSMLLNEISLPSNPAANKGLIYLKDVTGTTTPFFLDSAGTETSLIGAGAANQIIDGNTSATVLDSAPSFVVALNGIQKFSIQNTRIDYANLDLHGVDIINFDDTASTLMAQLGGTSTANFDLNVISTSSILRILFDGDESARFTDGRFQLFSATPNTLSASMSFFRDDPSPTAADALADIDFDGNDSVGNFTTYVSLLGGIESPTSAAELGRFTVQVAGGSGSGGALVQAARINFGSIELNDMYIELDEISLPSNPAANKGLIYLKDVASVTTPFFLDSSGTETSLIAGGGFSAGDTHTWTALQTFDVGTGAEGILMSDGTKIEFEDGAVTNLEMRAIESGLRDPGDMTITTRPGLEIDLNTGAIPDTEVFHIGDGVANPWMLIDDTTVRFNSAQTGATGHQLFLSRDNIPTDGQDISEIFAQTKIGASTWLKFAFIRFTALDVEVSATNNEGQMRLGVVSNNTLNTAINIEGLAGVSDVKIGFFSGTTPVGQQQLDAAPTATEISTALRNLGLTKL